MPYYPSIEVKQNEEGVFITQERYANEVLKKNYMGDCKVTSEHTNRMWH